MSDIIKRISEDIDEYLDLCEEFGEEPQMEHGSPDCYGEHAEGLRTRKHEMKKANK